MNKIKESVQSGTSNVFADLGLAEAEELSVQAELARLIYLRIKQRDLTQIQAGQLLGLKQPDVSKLMNGRHTGFSTERLFRFLNALDQDVQIIVSRKPANARRNAGVKVVAA